MGTRRVIHSQDAAFPPGVPPRARSADDYRTRLLTYIPADVVAAWVFLDRILHVDPIGSPTLHWIVFGVVLVLTPLWTWYATEAPALPAARVLTSTVAFAVWVFALGGPFVRLGWYTPTLAAVLLVLYTLAAPLIPFLAGKARRRTHPREVA
jgi:hypothetical protein